MARRFSSRSSSSIGGAIIGLLLLTGFGGAGFWHATRPKPQRPPATPVPVEASAPAIPLQAAAPQPAQTAPSHLAWGTPGRADIVVSRTGYALGFSRYHRQPRWVSYQLTRAMVQKRAASRQGLEFQPDPTFPNDCAQQVDYTRSGYDRGHLAPAADLNWSPRAMAESFYFSNVSPQDHAFNAGIWQQLEDQMRHFAYTEGEIYIVTGPILPEKKQKTIGPNQVTVPAAFYKVVLSTGPPRKMLAFILPNVNSKQPLQHFLVPAAEVERRTGLRFFTSLPPDEAARLKANTSPDGWQWKNTQQFTPRPKKKPRRR